MNTLKALALSLSLLALTAHAAPVNVNTADAQALAAGLVGVGPRVAEAIVEYRRAHGPFQRVEDLTKVRGIGPKILERNRTSISLGATAPSPATKR